MGEEVWVFGYGSLASPASVSRTLGRPVSPDRGWRAGHLEGFGRRWNYGSLRLRGNWELGGVPVAAGVVVSLGLVRSEETCNGALVRVSQAELRLLDHRESDYERTDVTDRIAPDGGPALDGPVVTYVPRPSAVSRYEQARDAGRAAVRQEYWDLVHDAFAVMGRSHLEHLSDRTPPPDVPVVDVELAPPA